jgi:integrase
MAVIAFTTDALKDVSKEIYRVRINYWLKMWRPAKTLEWLMDNPVKAVARMTTCKTIAHSPSNHHNYLTAIIAYIRHELGRHPMFEEWKRIQIENFAPIREHYLSGLPTERQKKMEVEWADVIRVRDALPMSATKILLAFHTMLDPIRCDLYKCHLFDTDDEEYVNLQDNYITIEPATLYLNDYKTSKTHGRQIIPLPDELAALLFDYMAEVVRSRSLLFETETGDFFTRNSFSKWTTRKLTAAFEKPMNITALRHSYISNLDFNRKTKELGVIAKKMGQTLGMQRAYRWDDTESKNEVIEPE